MDVGRHPNITLRAYTDVLKVEGDPGNFQVTLRKKARFISETKCTGCGACAEACPVVISDEYNLGLGQSRAAFRYFAQGIPAAFTINKRGVAPCKAACPAGISVQGYVALIAQGRYQEALNLVKQTNPFPATCGRVCNHPCESACNRAQIEEPIATMYLHRFVADLDLQNESPYSPAKKEPNGKKVAVIGAGPGGLTAGYYLAVEGYQVTIFEAMNEAGGWLRYGIPDYRLPRDVLNGEIDLVKQLGVEIRTGMWLGKDFKLADLRKDGYEAIFLAIGTQKSTKLNIPGEDLPGVFFGGDFLRDINDGKSLDFGEKVAIVGGGNVAMDAARTSLRLGAKEVHVLYRRSREEMPAAEEEVIEAEDEGIHFHYLTAPVEVLPNETGKVGKVRCIRMELGEPDQSGRRRPVPVSGSEYDVPIDSIISAIGLASDLAFLDKEPAKLRPKISRWGTFEVDPITYETSCKGIFAGGDVVTGAATVVQAIGAGKAVAISIDRLYKGEDLKAGRDKVRQPVDVPPGDFPPTPRKHMTLLSPEVRKGSFEEVQLGYSEQEAVAEANRCLQCGICSECYRCVDACLAGAVEHEMEPREEVVEAGAVVLATGYDLFDASRIHEYGYGRIPNVITALELERLLSASGPTHGHLYRPSDLALKEQLSRLENLQLQAAEALRHFEEKHQQSTRDFLARYQAGELQGKTFDDWAKLAEDHRRFTEEVDKLREPVERIHHATRLAFIQCVGSRDMRFNKQCSGFCCMHAIKEAIIAREHDPEVEVLFFGMDIRAVGKGFEEYRNRGGREAGIQYIRSRVAEITQNPDLSPVVWYENTRKREISHIPVDLVILATACEPSKGTKELAQIVGIETNEFGFFKTDPFTQIDTTRPGIFACGCAQGPMDIPESVAQASSTAARVAMVLTGERRKVAVG